MAINNDEYNRNEIIISNNSTESNLVETTNIVNINNINLIDIENQNLIQNEAHQLNRTEYEKNKFRDLGLTIIKILIIMYSSFSFLDFYCVLNDDSCTNQELSSLNLSLDNFLIIRGFLLLEPIVYAVVKLSLLEPSITKSFEIIKKSISIPISIKLLIWNIIGSVLFWAKMNTYQCSNSIYNYIFASLLILFVCIGISLLTKIVK